MSIYLYGLLEPADASLAEETLAGLEGVTGPVDVIPCDGYVLLSGMHAGDEILPRRRLLLTHARVLETAMACGTVLPMRFGMVSPSFETFKDLAGTQSTEIADAFARLRGKVEIGVRVTAAEDSCLAATLAENPGLARERDRLQGRGAGAHFDKVEFGRRLGDAVAERRKLAQRQVLNDVRDLAAAHILKTPDSDFDILRAEFLLDANNLTAFSDRLEIAVAETDFSAPATATARLVGPGPAFHFVDLALNPADAEAAA